MRTTTKLNGLLEGKVAIVTGGASGIGEAICRKFASEGAALAIIDLDNRGAEAVATDIDQSECRASVFIADVADHEQVESVVAETVRQFGTVDILVNCAGVNVFSSPDSITQELWRKILSVNLDGTWNVCRAAMPEMVRKRSGKIINISSAAGLLAIPKAAHYTAAKHGVVGLTRALAVDLGSSNINVNCICPGVTLTPLSRRAVSRGFLKEAERQTPLGRLGEPSDIASVALFLASSASDWMTGVALPVDGGLVACIRAHHWE